MISGGQCWATRRRKSPRNEKAATRVIDPAGDERLRTPHPVYKVPSREQALAMGPEKLRQLALEREELIRLENEDAYRFGYYLSCWSDADKLVEEQLLTAIFGGNGAGKSYYMARKGVEMMLN